MDTKLCPVCQTRKPISEFGKHKNMPDGLYPKCKNCVRAYYLEHKDQILANQNRYYEANKSDILARQKEYRDRKDKDAEQDYQRAYRAANRERLLAQKREYYQAHRVEHMATCKRNYERRRDEILAYSRNYHRENRERLLTRMREYRVENGDVLREKQRAYQKQHPETIKVSKNNRRARLANCEGRFTKREWNDLKATHNYTCLCCGKQEPEIKLVPDHVIPLSKGGRGSIDNIQPLCRFCNQSKAVDTTDYRPTTSEPY